MRRATSTATRDLKKQPPHEMSCSSPGTLCLRAPKSSVTGSPSPKRGCCRCSSCPGMACMTPDLILTRIAPTERRNTPMPRGVRARRVLSIRHMQAGGDTRRRAGWTLVSPDRVPRTLFSRRKHWAERFGTAPVLPTTRAEMDALGWDSCDVVLVTGDAYVDHPSFGMALVGRLLEAQGFRVGILAQPDWRDVEAFRALGRPNVLWGVTAGNMD